MLQLLLFFFLLHRPAPLMKKKDIVITSSLFIIMASSDMYIQNQRYLPYLLPLYAVLFGYGLFNQANVIVSRKKVFEFKRSISNGFNMKNSSIKFFVSHGMLFVLGLGMEIYLIRGILKG